MSDSSASTAPKPNLWQRYVAWRKKRKEKKKNQPKWKEWRDSIVFALVAAVIIRTFFFEAYVIPTGSMERSLLVGDFLFVSKLSYGPRLPMAPLSVPLVHNKLPGTETKSYLDWLTFPYARLGACDVERNDAVVFNYPAHDKDNINNPAYGTVDVPSMKENYIKRCVALPGDKFEIRDGQVYVNDKKGDNPEGMQMRYYVVTKDAQLGPQFMESLGFRGQSRAQNPNSNWISYAGYQKNKGENAGSYFYPYEIYMPPALVPKFKTLDAVEVIEQVTHPKGYHHLMRERAGDLYYFERDSATRAQILSEYSNPAAFRHRLGPYPAYPHAKQFPWNPDWYGPVIIPKAGESVELTTDNLPLYARIINVYEDHDLAVSGDKIMIDGTPATRYTFEMDYFFMMGDNRYNSEDGRFWGFVPESHVIGKPMFVGINWQRGNRFFKEID